MGSQAKSEFISADRLRVPEAKAAGLRPYWAEGDGPLLVNVSGLDGTGELFFKQAAMLARSFRVITFRQRDDGNFTYEDLADDIAAIVEANSPSGSEPRATIVAESFGGGVALTFALRYPEMVERLVIVNSFPRYRERLRINLAVWFSGLMPFKALWPLRMGASGLGLYLDGVSAEDRRRFFQAARSVSGVAYSRRLRLIRGLDLDERLEEITAPTLLVAATRDLVVRSAREARFMAERMPNSALKIVDGAGHACLLGSHVCLAELIQEMMNDEG